MAQILLLVSDIPILSWYERRPIDIYSSRESDKNLVNYPVAMRLDKARDYIYPPRCSPTQSSHIHNHLATDCVTPFELNIRPFVEKFPGLDFSTL